MVIFQKILIGLTLLAAFFCGHFELKIKDELTEDALKGQYENVSDFGLFNDISNLMKRERFLKTLTPEQLFKYRAIVCLKFVFVAALVLEVFLLLR